MNKSFDRGDAGHPFLFRGESRLTVGGALEIWRILVAWCVRTQPSAVVWTRTELWEMGGGEAVVCRWNSTQANSDTFKNSIQKQGAKCHTPQDDRPGKKSAPNEEVESQSELGWKTFSRATTWSCLVCTALIHGNFLRRLVGRISTGRCVLRLELTEQDILLHILRALAVEKWEAELVRKKSKPDLVGICIAVKADVFQVRVVGPDQPPTWISTVVLGGSLGEKQHPLLH